MEQHLLLQQSGAVILHFFWEMLALLCNSFETGTWLDRLHALFESYLQVLTCVEFILCCSEAQLLGQGKSF